MRRARVRRDAQRRASSFDDLYVPARIPATFRLWREAVGPPQRSPRGATGRAPWTEMTMQNQAREAGARYSIVYATGEEPIFRAGHRIRVSDGAPIGHYRVPTYLRGK